MNDTTDYLWDPTLRPDPEIVRLEQALRGFRLDATTIPASHTFEPRQRISVTRMVNVAAAAIVLAVAGTWGAWHLSKPAPWSVEILAGNPSIVRGAGAAQRVGVGGEVETDQVSVARIAVGNVGVADLAPGSRVRVLRDDKGEHRLALSHGTIHASIWARPRFFVVETPGATAVDLGCMYTLTVDSSGAGILAVSFGEVQLETPGGGAKTLVAAGTAAKIYKNRLGLPFPVTASATFKEAVLRADQGEVSDSMLGVLLHESDAQATITLWHLLERADSATRRRIYDRITTLVPAPDGATRVATVALDPQAVSLWLQVLRPKWNSEPNSPLRRLLVRVGLVKPAMQIAVRRAATGP